MTNQNNATPGTDMVLSPRQERAIAARDAMEAGGRTAPLVPRTFIEAQAFCGALAQSDLIPQKLKDRAADVLVLVLAGMEIGLTPMASIRMHHVIEGIPRLSADGLAAIVMQSPECEYLECSSTSDTACTWITKRRGRPEKSVTWTIERAKRAGLTEKRNRDGSPGMWSKYPENMLSSRAKGEICRQVYPDICAGMVTREEAVDRDFIDAEYTEQVAKPTQASGFMAAPPADAKPSGLPPGVASIELTAKPKKKDKPSDPTPPPVGSGSSTNSSGSLTNSASSSSETNSPPTETAFEQELAARKNQAAPIGGNTGAPLATDSTSPPSGSVESAATSPSTDSGATDDPADDAFGEDPPPPAKTMADFAKWVASCKSQRELAEGRPAWKEWSFELSKTDPSFKKGGENADKMQEIYSKRKAEVPA